jgi:hypothetical protein
MGVRTVRNGFVYAQMKADRAKKHLDELNRELAKFLKDAYTITGKDNGQKQWHVIRFEFNPMPEAIAFLAGEFAYALRSGLDQLAWQLAFLNTRPKHPRTHTSFPMWSAPPRAPRTFAASDAVKDILPAAIPIIESLQPYNGSSGYKMHPLYMLNELCVIDKHTILPIKASDGKINITGANFFRRRELNYGFELYYDLVDKYKIQLDPIKTEIIFGEPIDTFGNIGLELRIGDFTTIYDFVRNDVIPRFAGFFGHAGQPR